MLILDPDWYVVSDDVLCCGTINSTVFTGQICKEIYIQTTAKDSTVKGAGNNII